jgi:apolipoprotein D and lipocalin family protein
MRNRTKFILTASSLAVATLLVKSFSRPDAPLETVPDVDLNRYQGKWYEIASIPQRFTKGCHCTSAAYKLNPAEGYVEVYNSCYKGGPNGKLSDVKGKAFPVEGSNNSKLKVQFFWPFRGDYWILELDPDYRYVMVGSPDRETLWFLARTPTLEKAIFDLLVQQASSKGFPVDKLELMDQSCSEK